MSILDEFQRSIAGMKSEIDCPEYLAQTSTEKCCAILEIVAAGSEGATILAMKAKAKGEKLPPEAREGLLNLAGMLVIAAEQIEAE